MVMNIQNCISWFAHIQFVCWFFFRAFFANTFDHQRNCLLLPKNVEGHYNDNYLHKIYELNEEREREVKWEKKTQNNAHTHTHFSKLKTPNNQVTRLSTGTKAVLYFILFHLYIFFLRLFKKRKPFTNE